VGRLGGSVIGILYIIASCSVLDTASFQVNYLQVLP